MIATIILGSFCLLGLLLRAEWRGYQLSRKTEQELMAELNVVAMAGVALAALEYPSLHARSSGLNPWLLIGGWGGLQRMHANSTLLLALAAQAQVWDRHSSVVAIQQMRRDLLALRRAVLLSVWDQAFARASKPSSNRVHMAAHAYYDMTELLLKLYRHSPSRLYTHLENALWPGLNAALDSV